MQLELFYESLSGQVDLKKKILQSLLLFCSYLAELWWTQSVKYEEKNHVNVLLSKIFQTITKFSLNIFWIEHHTFHSIPQKELAILTSLHCTFSIFVIYFVDGTTWICVNYLSFYMILLIVPWEKFWKLSNCWVHL